ncbi:DUF481 domain-containing protein [Vibrio sp. PP-XX7]
MGSKMYLYTNFNGIDSKYSAYFKDYTLSAGYGYQLTHTEHLTVELELGPGYRYQKPNVDEIDSDDLVFAEKIKEPIVRGNVTVVWAITEDVRVESGNVGRFRAKQYHSPSQMLVWSRKSLKTLQ